MTHLSDEELQEIDCPCCGDSAYDDGSILDEMYGGRCEFCYRTEEICEGCGGVGYTIDHRECGYTLAACKGIDCQTCDGTEHPDARGRFTIWENESPHSSAAGVLT